MLKLKEKNSFPSVWETLGNSLSWLAWEAQEMCTVVSTEHWRMARWSRWTQTAPASSGHSLRLGLRRWGNVQGPGHRAEENIGHEAFIYMSLTACLLSCSVVSNSMDCNPPGSSVHWILQARRLEWVAMPSFRGSSWPKDRTQVSYVSCIGRWVLYHQHHLGSPGTPQYLGNKAGDRTTPNSNAIYPSFLPLAIQRLGSGLESHTSLYVGLEQILRQGSHPFLVSLKQRKKYRDSFFPLPRAESKE